LPAIAGKPGGGSSGLNFRLKGSGFKTVIFLISGICLLQYQDYYQAYDAVKLP
jgi:hypothetical protein